MNNLRIGFIGGVSVGTSTIIRSLWERSIIECNDSSVYNVTEEIPGRGSMSFEVKQLNHVLFSQMGQWMSNEANLQDLQNCSSLIFVFPASSFGYSQEISFIRKLSERRLMQNKHVSVILSKVDYLEDDDCENMSLSSVTELWDNIKNIYCSLKDVLEDNIFSINSIIPLSAVNDWNYSKAKENIWENVIEYNNDSEYREDLPTIVIAGKRGSGKSSTLNELFGLHLPTNKAVACTKYPMVIHVKVEHNGILYEWNIVDLPGIAESIDADMKYNVFYQKYIDKASLLLCLSQADTRAYLRDEEFYNNLIASEIITPATRLIIAINQIDLLFKSEENLNGIDLESVTDQHELIQTKIDDCFDNIYRKIFKDHSLSRADVCAFSALHKWNLNNLLKQIITKTY